MNYANLGIIVAPSGQPLAADHAACPACPHCASLPSSNSAYQAISGQPGGWLRVGRDWLIRGVLISTGLWLYDRQDKRALYRGLAGSAAIEGFVLAWTWWNAPRPMPAVQPPQTSTGAI